MVRKRLVWVGAIALLVIVGAAAVAGAQEPEYGDDDGSVHEESLRLLQRVGVLAGLECGPAAICPKDPIDRTMMAVWVIRARDYVLLAGQEPGQAEWEPHPGLEDLSSLWGLSWRFADAGDFPEVLLPYAGRLYSEGISAGCRPDPLRYCHDSPVTRGQMASFLVRAFDLEEAPAVGFSDIEGSVHAGSIDALAASGVTAGCSADPLLYCPNDPVTRGQMATFLVRAMSLWFPQDASELIDCDDFPTRADAQIFHDRYQAYGDFAGLDDGQFPGIACEDRPGAWNFRKDVNALTDQVTYWVNTRGTRDVGTEGGIPGPYFGVNCGWDSFVNLREDYDEETVEVAYRFYPNTEVTSETWTADKQGDDTFLSPPADPTTSTFLLGFAEGVEELRMQVEYETYRFPIDDFAVAFTWLQTVCSG